MMRTVKFTSAELSKVLDALEEYIDVFGEAEDTALYTEYMLDTGLGSALRKLRRCTKGSSIYEKYPFHHESDTFPTFEEWKKWRELKGETT